MNEQSVERNGLFELWLSVEGPSGLPEKKRSEPRRHVPPEVPAILSLNGREITVAVLNVSRRGLGVASRVELAPNTEVLVRLFEGDDWLHARVVHCTRSIGNYKVGLCTE